MSSKDKELSKSKFKLFMRTVKPGGNASERILRPEIERELRPEQPVAQRCKMLKELADAHLATMNLDEISIINLWDLTKDLIVPNKPAETRQIALTFYRRLIQTQYKNLTFMREKFFLVIQNHGVAEDLKHLLELLDTLTENGKDITNFEEKIGHFMILWIPAITEANLLCPYLKMLINLIKFNAAHLDKEVLEYIVHNACHLSCTVVDDDIGLQCLTVLEMVIGYTIFPSEPLLQCIYTLCRTVNHVRYCQASWKIMKNLLGTQLGYHAMKLMFNILNDRNLYDDAQLLRGAVFHLYMNIFSSNVIFQVSPMHYASTVLKGFLSALESCQVIVTFEVILSVRQVINKYKFELSEIVWDLIFYIMMAVLDNIEHYESSNLDKESLYLQKNFHENIDCIEKLLLENENKLHCNIERIYDLIERVADKRPEESVLNLIEYRSKGVTPMRPAWISVLTDFVRRYYKVKNTNVRIKIINSLIRIMDLNRATYEEEILDRVVITLFSDVHQETDLQVRVAAVRALVNFARHCETKRCTELLDILEKLINRPFVEQQLNDGSNIKNDADIMDIIAAVDGLIEVFAIKLYRLPSTHAIKIFNILVNHLTQHYERSKIFEHTTIVRYKIFSWMLKARVNASYHIGFPDATNNDALKFSYYLGIDSPLPPHNQTTTISIRKACKLIVYCLEYDHDYQIFQIVIKELPKVLQNKALIQGNDIEELALALLKINGSRFKRTTDEIQALVLPAVAALVIYHEFLQPRHQLKIIEALRIGIFSNIANVCINTMITIILEMPEALMRTLPDLLLHMSKMSDTTMVAIPVLEFLSILSRLSNHLFTNFTAKQYMYVFAISLPYTKPHRYDHYTVSLAHHVITGWFLKCKLELRKNYVPYIISSIHSNTSMLYDDLKHRNVQHQDFNSLNEDSSNRKRSTSLTERGSRNNTNLRNDSEMRPLMNDSLKTFHAELAETCIDFLARHTFSPCSTLPKRLPTVEYLLKDGLSQTWLVGHNLVTITTSGCPSLPTRHGLCERCAQLGKAPSISLNAKSLSDTAAPLSPEILSSAPPERRYTKVSLQHSSGNESAGSTELTSSSSTHSTTQRQTSNSSTASLEALSRRGSNPEAMGAYGEVINTTGSTTSLLGNSLSHSSSMSPSTQSIVQQPVCVRACTGWAEILIRRPTGNISWITRMQNPIANDCFGSDLPLNNMVSLFLPTAHGGVFGPDVLTTHATAELQQEFLQPTTEAAAVMLSIANTSVSATAAATTTMANVHAMGSESSQEIEVRRRMVAKARALHRQEEISSVSAGSVSVATAAIDIPRATVAGKRGKDALSGSVSDGEADEEALAFEDVQSRARNPVRRVNSSPEMSSSWRQAFLAAKPTLLSQELYKHDINSVEETQQHLQLQKKKSVRVSCEAIPEEIASSTPPHALEADANTLPPKQHSADDVNSQVAAINQAANTTTNIINTTARQATLKLQGICGKPSLSPLPAAAAAQTVPPSPRLEKSKTPLFSTSVATSSHPHPGLAKSSSSGGTGVTVTAGSAGTDYNNGDMMRGRSKTISVVREVNNGKARPQPTTSFRGFGSIKPPINSKLCINPSFMFLQLYHTGQLQVTDPPLKVPAEQNNVLTVLDHAPPFETHKIGVLYIGRGQCNNLVEILRNSYGSTRYVEFLRSIGTLVSLKEAEQNNVFVALDKGGTDGKFAYVWKDDIVQVTFHVATLMPTNLKKDPNCNEKKKHIGNDYVNIVYNESGEEYNLSTISGQFSYACVIVEPLELNTNRIYTKARPEIAKFVCHPEPKIVSDRSAPLLARQLALHANLASQVYQSVQKKNPYASNWLERLRIIKRLRSKLIENQNQSSGGTSGSGNMHIDDSTTDPLKKQNTNRDFTKYT